MSVHVKNVFQAWIWSPVTPPLAAPMDAQVSPAWEEMVLVQTEDVEPPAGMQIGVYAQMSEQFKNEFAVRIALADRPNLFPMVVHVSPDAAV